MNYFDHISINIPEWLCVVLLLVLCVMAIVIFSRKGVIRIQLRRLLRVMFVEYLVLLFCSTVIFREDASNTYVRLMPFKGYFTGDMRLFIDALQCGYLYSNRILLFRFSSLSKMAKDSVAISFPFLHNRTLSVYSLPWMLRHQ